MFPASTNQMGMNAAFPDVCKTPAPPSPSPVPIPYPNMSMMNNAQGTSCARKVKICKKKAVTKNTVISMSTGDEAGSMMGVVSNKIKGKTKFRTGSMKVKVEGHPLVHLTCLTGHNGDNANMPAGCHVAPSQVKVLVSP